MKIIGEPEITQPVHKQTVDKQIVIDTNPYRTRVALLEDGKTVELHIEQRSNDMLRRQHLQGQGQQCFARNGGGIC